MGDAFAHVGSITSPSSAPSRVLDPSGRSLTLTRKSGGNVKNSGVSSFTSAEFVSALSHDSAMEWNCRSGASYRPLCSRRWCAGAARMSQ